jgi:uracil-DNA glycosylase
MNMPGMLRQLFEKTANNDWLHLLHNELNAEYFHALGAFVNEQRLTNEVFPAEENIFRAFSKTPLTQVKVVILGQDPYHGPNQANGLAFSVSNNMKLPPSLKNIYKELQHDISGQFYQLGDLTPWAEQGVLLLNAALTVNKSKPNSHQKQGWERFTDVVIQQLSHEKQDIVFLLWGNYARAKKVFIDQTKHLVLEAAHPSPFSAYNGFFGSNHFSKTNEYLRKHGKSEINCCT